VRFVLHFLSQRESGTRGRMPGEETLRRSIIAALVAAAAPFALAQNTGEPAVVVTATRFPESRLEAPIGMTVITAEQIAESTAKTLPELLSREAGIVTRDNAGSPDWQIDMRGFGITGDQNTLVLFDGQRLNENELVSVRWSAIPIESIERIEIMRGSGSVLYGRHDQHRHQSAAARRERRKRWGERRNLRNAGIPGRGRRYGRAHRADSLCERLRV